MDLIKKALLAALAADARAKARTLGEPWRAAALGLITVVQKLALALLTDSPAFDAAVVKQAKAVTKLTQ